MRKLLSHAGAMALLALAMIAAGGHAQAAVTTFLSAGSGCSGGATATFTPGGAPVTVSLCASTTTEALCGTSYRFQAANAAESGRFQLTSRTLSANYNFSNTPTVTFPLPIENPASGPDLGSGTTSGAAVPPGANQLLATYTIAPQATATNASYVISMDAAISIAAVDSGTGDCGAANAVPLVASFTFNQSGGGGAPAFTSANNTAFTINAPGSFTVSASGTPAPTISLTGGTLPAGVSFNSGTRTLAGTPAFGTAGTYNLTFTAANGNPPDATQNFTLTVLRASQTINFTNPGTQTFGSGPVALNATASSGNTVTFSSLTPSVCSVSGSSANLLQAGTCTLAANQAGDSNYAPAPQVTQSFTINAVAPGAPTIGSATAGNGSATVSFTPPASNGGSAIIDYTVTCNPGSVSATGAGSPVTVTGLANGTTYTCSATARNAAGSSTASGTVSVTPTAGTTVPGAPTIGTATAGNGQATITFSAPASNGGSAIIDYTATCNPGGASATAAGSPITVTGLANGTAYTCSVTARNAVGTGPASGTVSVTPTAGGTAPAFTSGTSATFTVTTAGSFTVTASGTPSPSITLTGGTLPAGLSFTPGTGSATITGSPALGTVGTYNLTFTAANGNPPNATQNVTLTVARANQSISFAGPGPQTFSNTPVPLSATASSGLAVTFSSTTPAICSVSGNNATMLQAGTCTIAADQAGNANFNAATQVTSSFAITKANQTITFPAQPDRQVSTTPVAISPAATASSGLAVTYSSLTPATCTVSGSAVTTVAVGTCTLAANQAGNGGFNAAAQVTASFQVTQGTQAITFPQPPDVPLDAQSVGLTATASSGLAVSYASLTTATCTVSGSTVTLVALGACTIRASQAGNASFSAAAPVDKSFNIVPAGALTLFVTPASVPYRTAVVATAQLRNANATGTVTFSFGTGTVLCTNVPVFQGRADCPVPADLIVNNPTFIVANYSGDGGNAAGTAAAQVMVDLNANTVTMNAFPSKPVAGRPVVLTALVVSRNPAGTVNFTENGATVAGCANVALRLLPGGNDAAVATCTIAGITAGSHTYVAANGNAQASLAVTAATSGPVDHTDMWWAGEQENGWGVSITQHGNVQVVVIYTYDNSGRPVFYIMPGGSWDPAMTTYSGQLYQPTGSPFNAYDVRRFAAGAPVGSASITYTGEGTATLSYTINGVSGSKSIRKQFFANDDGIAKLRVNDLWWYGSEEDGWGINIAQQGRMLFPVWYTYDAQGRATFMVVPGGSWSGTSFTGDIYATTGSPWLGVAYNPASLGIVKVGTMRITFSDQNTATATYTVNGVTQSKRLTRQPY